MAKATVTHSDHSRIKKLAEIFLSKQEKKVVLHSEAEALEALARDARGAHH